MRFKPQPLGYLMVVALLEQLAFSIAWLRFLARSRKRDKILKFVEDARRYFPVTKKIQ